MSAADRSRVAREAPPRFSAASRLLRLLAAYSPADEAEGEHRRRMLELAAYGDSAFSRRRYVPGHFTASAFVLSPDRTALLFVFHQRFRRWLQPGGHIDPGDVDVFAAARREVAEETGVVCGEANERPPVLFDLDVHAIPAGRGEPRHEHFDLRVLLRAQHPELQPDSDARDARWVDIAAIAALDTDSSVGRAVAKIERQLRSERASG